MPDAKEHFLPRRGTALHWGVALWGLLTLWLELGSGGAPRHLALGGLLFLAVHFGLPPLWHWRCGVPNPSGAACMALFAPLAVLGLATTAVDHASAWHLYFHALSYGAFTAMAWIFPSPAKGGEPPKRGASFRP